MKFKFIKGLEGVIAAESAISHVDGEKGKLVYRGYDIYDLARHSSFEEVIHILWHGKLPKKSELNDFKRNLNAHMKLPGGFKRLLLPNKVPLMASLRTGVSLLAGFDKEADDNSPESNKRKALSIMAKMPSIIAALYRVQNRKKIIKPKSGVSFAANFLYMLNGKLPTKEEEKVMDICLILHAEHGLNASTFSARVTVATLSDMYSGIVSAIGTLKGPLHGGANVKAINTLHSLADQLHVRNECVGTCLDNVDKYVDDLLKHHVRIMGIGHRVYKVKDPRAIILEEFAKNVSKKHIKYFQMAKETEKYMAKNKNLYPNVDFFSGLVYENLGINRELYVCLFALSRTAGWIAHILEQYANNRLIRPRQLYTGKLHKRYVPIERR